MGKPGRPKGSEIKLPKEDIIRDYEAGYGIQQIADKYGSSRTTVIRRLHTWGVKVRRPGRPLALALALKMPEVG